MSLLLSKSVKRKDVTVMEHNHDEVRREVVRQEYRPARIRAPAMNERPIPDAALEDENSVEVLRVWIAAKKLHCSMKVGMYRETTKVAEETAWGTILADVARHLADALESGYALDAQTSLRRIRDSFLDELAEPTSDTEGGFGQRH
jgi:hypothetical protein